MAKRSAGEPNNKRQPRAARAGAERAGTAAAGRSRSKSGPTHPALVLRIIGGRHRGRQLLYSGDPTTRPMKDDVRESLFNLVGGWLVDKWVVDLFAGTGAVGLEAISRGAASATLVERHFPTARLIRENAADLGELERIDIQRSDAFFWSRQFLNHLPDSGPAASCGWAVFCSPPWPLFRHQRPELLQLITDWCAALPPDSLMVVESDLSLRVEELPNPDVWRTRDYPPARLSILRPPGENRAG